MEKGYFSQEDIPDSYKNKYTSQAILRNLYKFINYVFDGDENVFIKVYDELTKTDPNSSWDSNQLILKKIKGTAQNRRLTVTDAKNLEQIFRLEEDCLLSFPPKKEVAYVMVSCSPSKVKHVFEALSPKPDSNGIIDECSALTGEADIFLRLFGSRKEISDFIFERLGGMESEGVRQTKTHFSMLRDVRMRYPIPHNPLRKPTRPVWLSEEWLLESRVRELIDKFKKKDKKIKL